MSESVSSRGMRIVADPAAGGGNPSYEDEDYIIQTRGVELVYRIGERTVQALRGVDLDIGQKRFVVLKGRSGSGKGIDRQVEGFGRRLKEGIRDRYQAQISLLGFGTKLDNPGTFVELDPSGRRDRYGMPIARIHSAYHGNDLKIFEDIKERFTEILEQAGAEHLTSSDGPAQPGTSEHEVGTCRMTQDPKDGVCDGFGRTHEVRNLFVADGSVFTQQTDKSPTLTIMALALRQADFIVDSLKRGDLRGA